MDFKFVDLFCGIGGFHLAMEQLGGKCVFSCEIDKKAREVYKDNFGIEPMGDIRDIDISSIPDHDVLCAGFPCQPFSKAGNRLGFLDETRGTLFFEIEKILIAKKPKYIILENVKNLVGHDNGRTLNVIKKHLKDIGYRLNDKNIIISPHHLGIPQNRERIIIIGVYDKFNSTDISIDVKVDRKKQCDIDNIIDHNYINNKITQEEEYILNAWDDFYNGIKEKIIGFPVWMEYFVETYNNNNSNAKWKENIIKKNISLYLNNKEFIDKWLIKYDFFKNVKPTLRKLEWQCGDSISSLWDGIIQIRPSGIRVKKSNCFPALVAMVQIPIIGKMKRRLTVIEALRLQSFNDDFKLKYNDKVSFKQLGNAVNVEVIKHCMEQLFSITS